jgi:hypothetical protein
MKTPFDLYCDLVAKRMQKGREMPRRFQVVIYRALREHASGAASLDPQIAYELANTLRDVIGGVAGPLVSPNVNVGGKSREPTEQSCIEDAVRYRRAVEEGLIKDLHPIKTILEAYGGGDPMKGGLSRRTVQTWCNGKEFEEITTRVSRKDQISPLMFFSGRHYAQNYTKTARGESS